MSDADTTVKELIDHTRQFVTERDWDQFHSPKNFAMGLTVGTAALMEHFQWCTTYQSRQIAADPQNLTPIRHEYADVLSYLLGLAIALDIDRSRAFFEKMEHNELKYPTQKYHGRHKL